MYQNSGIRSLSLFSFVAVVAVVSPLAAQRSSTTRPAPKPVSPPSSGTSALTTVKGIWEPVNYKQDLELQSVYFVTPDIGWASGVAGTIIKTTDGGATWTPQLGGDPQNDARRISDLRFVDQNNGFAVQNTGTGDYVLLHTTDGNNWEASGSIAQHFGDYAFVSPTVGVQATARNDIQHTDNAGKTWKPAMKCALSVDVGGLSRNAQCNIESFHFPTPNVGYAIGPFLGGIKGVAVAKTENAGQSWNLWTVLPDESGHEGHIFFTDEQNGVACLIGGHFFSTSDGGKTWHGIAGADCGGKPAVRFADPEVGWTVADKWNYTSDGGKHWSSRPATFPARVEAFSLPRRDRGYVVGAHGMVFRYRIVPASYSAPNTIDAPIVGTVNSPLDVQVEQLVTETQSLVGADVATGAVSGGGSATELASTTAGSSSGTRRGGGNTLAKIQALLDAVGASVPQFLSRYRNLNLVFEGARTSASLPGWFETVKEGFASFRTASDKNAAANALAQIKSAADSLKTETKLAFQKTPTSHAP
jgi:photosystem II stability/assembly factor-like uncharacterized protein